MLTKNDCMSILIGMEDRGINVDKSMKKLLVSKDIPIDVLKFISQNQGLETVNFYEMLRKKHNKNKSPLYTNILNEADTIEKALTTLSCLLTQIILYGNKLELQQETFFKEIRAKEIASSLNTYFEIGESENCFKLLKLIKSDLLVLEYLNDRRELA